MSAAGEIHALIDASIPQFIASRAPWLLTVMVVWVVIYFLLLRFLNIGVRRIPGSVRRDDAQCMPISAIVSAHNQQRDLPACIASLLALDYPHGRLQIILVNDGSADGTGAIIDATASQHSHVRALHAGTTPSSKSRESLPGLAEAFAAATGEWVLVVAPNAIVRPEWARHLMGYVDAKTGMAGGAVLIRADGLWGAVERVAVGFLQTINYGMTGWGAPAACAGSNFAVRRSMYAEIAGKSKSHRDVDHFELFRAVTDRQLAVHLYFDGATTATVSPVGSGGQLVTKLRGWLGAGDALNSTLRSALPLTIGWTWGIAVFMLLGWTLDWRVWAAFLLLKCTHDLLMLRLQQKRMDAPHHVRYLPVFELAQLVTFAINPIIFLFRRRIPRRGDGYSVRP